MSGTFEIQVDGGEKLSQLIMQIQGKAQSLDRAMPIIAEILLGAVVDVVDAEGPGWPALSPATLLKRRKAGKDAKMLRDTGLMMQTLDSGIGPDFVEAFFGVPYAKYHIGNAEKPGKRNPLNLGPFEEGMIEDVSEVLLGQLA